MPCRSQDVPVASLVDPRNAECLDVLGPTIRILTPLVGDPDRPCVMRGTIPPAGFVPLHSHGDPEIFIVMSGELEALSAAADGFAWIPLRPGDIFHVPGGARHAFRNQSREQVVCTIISTIRLGSFFKRIGVPAGAGEQGSALTPKRLDLFLKTADEFGYWNASPDENARFGLNLGPAPMA